MLDKLPAYSFELVDEQVRENQMDHNNSHAPSDVSPATLASVPSAKYVSLRRMTHTGDRPPRQTSAHNRSPALNLKQSWTGEYVIEVLTAVVVQLGGLTDGSQLLGSVTLTFLQLRRRRFTTAGQLLQPDLSGLLVDHPIKLLLLDSQQLGGQICAVIAVHGTTIKNLLLKSSGGTENGQHGTNRDHNAALCML